MNEKLEQEWIKKKLSNSPLKFKKKGKEKNNDKSIYVDLKRTDDIKNILNQEFSCSQVKGPPTDETPRCLCYKCSARIQRAPKSEAFQFQSEIKAKCLPD